MNRISDELIRERAIKYRKHRDKFATSGFTWMVACELIPIAQLEIWDMFGLFQLAKGIPDGGSYLEIGAKWGGSMRCVLHAAEYMDRKVKATAIEPIPNQKFKSFCKERGIRYIKGYSENVYWMIPDASIDMLFIDGPHGYEQLIGDLRDYWSKVKAPGLMAGHDHDPKFPGIERAVREFFKEDYEVLPHSSIWMKKKNLSLRKM